MQPIKKYNSTLRFSVPSYNYTTKWYEKSHEKLLKNPDFSKCPSCNYTSRTKKNGHSIPSDVILVYCANQVKSLILFIRTLRHVKSRASVFLFVDSDAYNKINSETMSVLKDCGMNVINFGELPEFNIVSIFSIGFIVMRDFLIVNQKYIRNVLICDLYDIVFQADPFTYPFHMKELEFVSQMNFYNASDNDRLWITWYEPMRKEWNNTQIINSGQVIGSCFDMISFLDLYVNFFDPSDYFSIKTTDQAFFNLLFLKKLIDNDNIPYKIHYEKAYSRIMITLGLSPKEKKLGTIHKYRSSEYAPIVHMYYADIDLVYNLLDVCPRKSRKWTNYISLLQEKDVIDYEKETGVFNDS